MVAYRFCRPDDVPYLVRAVNECYSVHFHDGADVTLVDFQADVRHLDVWPSNCMVASQGKEPIAVCIASKREEEVLVSRLGTRPEHQRQGHASHMLSSLCSKLEVLGPPRLVVEVPGDEPQLSRLFRRLGYEEEKRYRSFYLEQRLEGAAIVDHSVSIRASDLEACGLLRDRSDYSWERQASTLLNRQDGLTGRALVSDRIEAFLLAWENPDAASARILALGSGESDDEPLFLPLLLRLYCQNHHGEVVIPRVTPEEVSFDMLQAVGFQRGREYIRMGRRVGSE